jgi:hypothetical protein
MRSILWSWPLGQLFFIILKLFPRFVRLIIKRIFASTPFCTVFNTLIKKKPGLKALPTDGFWRIAKKLCAKIRKK